MNKSFSIYEIADLNRSSLTSRDNYEYINYLDTSNLTRNKIENIQYLDTNFPSRAKRKVKADTILYSTVRPNQEHFGIVENTNINNLIVSTGFTTIDVKSNEINPKYLYYKLTNPVVTSYLQTIAENSVSAYPSVKPEEIGNLRFKFPVLKVQQKIAKVLSALDDKIELNNQINAELEAMAKTLYDYWFVQFDFPVPVVSTSSTTDHMPLPVASTTGDSDAEPVEATGIASSATATRGYRSSGGKMVYNEVLKREIPDGWEVKKLAECIEKIIDYRGRTPKKLETDWSENKDDIIALSAKHVKGGKLVNLEAANRVDANLYSRWMKEELKVGDILMTSEAPCGEFFYLIGDTKYCLSQRLFAMRANSKVIHHSCLYFELSAGNGYSQIMGKVSGSTVFGIRQDELRTVNVLVPAKELQQSFEEKVIPIYQKIRINEKQNQELAQLRDWLLPMLMNGQVTVGDVEEKVGMVAEEKTEYQKHIRS